MNEKQFAGKIALITGATSGIGRACAASFAAEGAKVACVGRNEKALERVAGEIRAAGADVLPLRSDISVSSEIGGVIAKTIETLGGIDILVNAAGHISSGTVENTSLKSWDDMLNVNVRAVFNLIQTALPSLIERKGNVVNISSVTGLRAFPGVLAYCVSKAALDQLTRCAALELAPKGVRVNAVNPGVVVSEIHKRGGMNDEAYAAFLEIAALVRFLASDQASWITGATYSIDGGRAQTCAR